jgi:hypothetical protein
MSPSIKLRIKPTFWFVWGIFMLIENWHSLLIHEHVHLRLTSVFAIVIVLAFPEMIWPEHPPKPFSSKNFALLAAALAAGVINYYLMKYYQ